MKTLFFAVAMKKATHEADANSRIFLTLYVGENKHASTLVSKGLVAIRHPTVYNQTKTTRLCPVQQWNKDS